MSEYYKQSLTAISKDEPVIQHFGILGMKWGVRRFQNKNGSLTALGKKRYSGDRDLIRNAKEQQERREAYAKTDEAINHNKQLINKLDNTKDIRGFVSNKLNKALANEAHQQGGVTPGKWFKKSLKNFKEALANYNKSENSNYKTMPDKLRLSHEGEHLDTCYGEIQSSFCHLLGFNTPLNDEQESEVFRILNKYLES